MSSYMKVLMTIEENLNKENIPDIELIPQSITTAPGLIQSPFTNFGLPIATTNTSASLICQQKSTATNSNPDNK